MLPSGAEAVVSSISSTAAGEGLEKKRRLGLRMFSSIRSTPELQLSFPTVQQSSVQNRME